jgi:hypothetical protein
MPSRPTQRQSGPVPPGPPRDEPQGGTWSIFLVSGLVASIGGIFLPGGWSRPVIMIGCALLAVAVVLLLLGGRRPRDDAGDRDA